MESVSEPEPPELPIGLEDSGEPSSPSSLGGEWGKDPTHTLKRPQLSRDSNKRILAQAETLSIYVSSLLNYRIQKLLFENSPVNENRG